MDVKSSSLSLSNFFVTKLDIQWKQGSARGTNKSEETIGLSFDYDIRRKVDQPNLFRLSLMVAINPDEEVGGIEGEVHIDGFFSFPESTEEKEMQYLIRVNGCSMLYSLLRGQLALISGSFPSGKVTLPAVVMNDIVKEIEEKKDQIATSE